MEIYNVTFGSKFAEQKVAKFFENKSAKIIDSAHHQAVDALKPQSFAAKQTESAKFKILKEIESRFKAWFIII